jgi:hypothetical protein
MSHSPGEHLPPHDLQRRLDENPNDRLRVIQEFFEEREKAGDIEGAAYAQTVRILEIERALAVKEKETMPWKYISPLLMFITAVALVIGLAFGSVGVWLVYLRSEGQTEATLFGQTIKSANVGIPCVFIGAIVVILVIRNILKTIRHTTTTLHKNNQGQR